MKKLGINIDGVVRDFLSQFDKQYRKVHINNPNIVAMNEDFTVRNYSDDELQQLSEDIGTKEKDLISLPVDTPDLLNHYQFDGQTEVGGDEFVTPQKALDEFLFNKYAFQIFGMAEEYSREFEIEEKKIINNKETTQKRKILKKAMHEINRIQAFGLREGLFETVLISKLKDQAITSTFHFLAKAGCRVKNIMFVDEEENKWEHCDIMIDCVPEVFQAKPKGKIGIKINREYNQWDKADFSFDFVDEVNNPDFLKKIFK